ncbi:3-oxoacyl-ACP reductase family protein [Cohnella lubricantis]|uniref:3-oxoacyl-ACP reductase FabG n=1 Tax=Cohnella lubricantis TaxID=2163172 RepID=A0A841TG73_9BACL|nr:3-oxoacyl-ACP reductase family protein [Cohnella lubricantis]MBB6677461.1 3-oxoacyl-ACP reductase FabG [Cohnella lubricantis]MBP2116653.1 3-oxoacyl-[acyl-carrier protein] reductase [Cohnella lubricantis]
MSFPAYGSPNCALVTGGSRGIGAACAVKLASVSRRVAITYRHSERQASEVADQIREQGAEAILIQADLTNPQSWGEQLDAFLKESGPVDFVVNNAGISRDNLCLHATLEELEEVFRVNVFSSWVTLTKAASHMVEESRGRIVNISSIAAHENSPGRSVYGASKAALTAFTRSFANELGRMNIRINAIAPGFINTELLADMPDKVKDGYIRKIPQRRFGEPEHIADMVMFLASDAADYLNGSIIPIDGGMST